MAIQLQPLERNIQRLVDAIIQLVQGRHNATGEVTLTPLATTTVVQHVNCSVDSIPLLSPRTASAAAAIPTAYISSVLNGQFTITHASSAAADQRFGYTVGGG